ncbi:porin family protein [Mucilaginibacter segetis]|uniref:PorT family protein n=1 Tax=Mucilaginibacter segetis TaxID=2793071 RepID=A0A934PY69_9SPHI|nr:porin family protein [Mucilaginibacter segetis]MBK0381236.1 PorT family protein [Mucilaginibacter segetis]
MKKTLFLAISLFIAGSVSAQRYHNPRRPPHRMMRQERRPVDDFYQPKVGITGGLNISNTVDAYNSNFSTSSITGVHAGLTFEIPLVYPLSFAPEILYSQKGYKAETNYGQFKQRTNYIDIPLLAKLRVVRGFNIVAGPQLTFLTSTKNIYDDGFNTVYEERYNNRGDKSYIAGVVGVGIDLNRNVELRARYNIDLQQNTPDDGSVPDYRNQVFQVGLGFRFQ